MNEMIEARRTKLPPVYAPVTPVPASIELVADVQFMMGCDQLTGEVGQICYSSARTDPAIPWEIGDRTREFFIIVGMKGLHMPYISE
jgi:hypothetical protein